MTNDLVRLLAAWALVHEMADEGWKAAVARGKATGPSGMEGGPGAFADGLAAMVAEEKEKLKAGLAGGTFPGASGDGAETAQELRFELGQVRARLEVVESSLEAVLKGLEEIRGSLAGKR